MGYFREALYEAQRTEKELTSYKVQLLIFQDVWTEKVSVMGERQ